MTYAVADIEGNYIACTKGPKGYKMHKSPQSIADVLKSVDFAVTYNGNRYDLPKLEEKVDVRDVQSVDLYKVIYTHYIKQYGHELDRYDNGQPIVPKGELTLDNVCTATLGQGKYKGNKVIRCKKDVEVTDKLFRYMKQHNKVYHTTYRKNKPYKEPIYLSRGWWKPGVWCVLLAV